MLCKFVNSTVMYRNFLISRLNCSFRQSMRFALASVCVLLTLSSCQDYDLGYTSTEISYETQFVKEFGNPAPGHQWGFDAAAYAMGCDEEVATRGVYKQDMNIPGTNLRSTIVYGKPKNITEHEHEEVYAWFSNHIINWDDDCTPTNYMGESTRICDGVAYVKTEGLLPWGSLATYSPEKLGNYSINVETPFFNGWIQHVASDLTYDEVAENGSAYNGSNMNYLKFRTLGQADGWEHLNDYNASNGYGYGNQADQNGILVTDANFNVVTYHCSADGGADHDKYYVVYLKGDDYEGWYLGMDLEAYGPNPSQQVKADGVCNDWIIKIADAGATQYNPSRIMCEDLGGSFDTDFNDLVYDVQYQNQVCVITLRAAGGTLPIQLYYGKKEEGGILLTAKGKDEVHDMFNVSVDVPVNVNARARGFAKGEDNCDPVYFALGFDKSGNENVDGHNVPITTMSGQFDFQKINIYVYNEQLAKWLNIDNINGSAPYRICVPTSVNWNQECVDIKSTYPGFSNWVNNPTKTFWNGNNTIDSDGLYR